MTSKTLLTSIILLTLGLGACTKQASPAPANPTTSTTSTQANNQASRSSATSTSVATSHTSSAEASTSAILPSETSASESRSSTADLATAESSSTAAAQSESTPLTLATTSSATSGESLFQTTLDKVAANTSEGHATHYAFYDIDSNGTPELITGILSQGSEIFPRALYYINQGVSTFLAESKVGPTSYRSSFSVYPDGTVSFVQWGSGTGNGDAYLYQLSPDNGPAITLDHQTFEKIQFPDFVRPMEEQVDLSQLDWQTF